MQWRPCHGVGVSYQYHNLLPGVELLDRVKKNSRSCGLRHFVLLYQ